MPSSTTIVKILWRYKQREDLSEDELEELRLWLMESPRNEELFDELSNSAKWDKEIEKWKGKDPDPTWNKITKRLESISPEAFKKKRERGRYLIAASILFIMMSATLYFLLIKNQEKNLPIVAKKTKLKEILPSGGGAILTLSNGNAIVLDSLTDGMQTKQGGTDIIKTDSEALAYKTTSTAGGEEKYNTLTTSKGNQYHLVLSDGTKVWINAASSLRFPVSFLGSKRLLELKGEAYFEVAKNKSMPFIVDMGRSSKVQVLGTHFNVKAYSDEPISSVTLLEGSVAVNNGKDSIKIKPDQTLRLNDHGTFSIESANQEQAIAWRNKIFWFKNSSFEEIMRELSRWYDMDVVYAGEIKASYTGIMPGNLPLSNVLQILEKGGNVHFTISEGNKVTVSP